jgi:hypothetical protein
VVTEHIEELWLSRAQTSALLGITARHFDEAVRPKLPPEATRGDRQALRFYAPLVNGVWIQTKVEQATRKAAPSADGDPLLTGGGDSPNLEEYRKWKAKREKNFYEVDVNNLVPRTEVKPALLRFGRILRGAGDKLAREFGNAAAEILNEATDEFVEAVNGAETPGDEDGEHDTQPVDRGTDAGDGGGGTDAEAPHDAAVR